MSELKPDVVLNIMFKFCTHGIPCRSAQGKLSRLVWRPPRGMVRLGESWHCSREIRNPALHTALPELLSLVIGGAAGRQGRESGCAQRQEEFEALSKLGYQCALIRNTQRSVPDADVQSHEGKAGGAVAASIKDWKEPLNFIELARKCGDLDADFRDERARAGEKYQRF